MSNTPMNILKISEIDTLLGPMIVIADTTFLYLLEFVTKKRLAREIERFRERCVTLVTGETPPIQSITTELASYFEGTLRRFKTPYCVLGSPFQQAAWQALCRVPYGETRSYAEQAAALGKPSAYRAVANANGANKLSIIIPCHRILASDGSLGGYSSGLPLKEWLLAHEQQHHSANRDQSVMP